MEIASLAGRARRHQWRGRGLGRVSVQGAGIECRRCPAYLEEVLAVVSGSAVTSRIKGTPKLLNPADVPISAF
jgi:hypothetical protein